SKQDSVSLPDQSGDIWEISFASGKGFNASEYELKLLGTNESTGGNSYEVITADSEVQNIFEVAVKSGTNYTEAASSLADTLKAQSGETPLLDIHEEGAYITGIYNGMIALVFTADGTDGLTYMMILYSNDTNNCIDILNSIIDDFLASDITGSNARTEYGETAGSSDSPAGLDGFPAFTVPAAFSSTYEGSFVASYSNGNINISIYSGPDDEFLRFLNGETDNYYEIYQMSELGSCDLTGYDQVVIAEGENTGIYVYFAGTRDGSLNIQFSSSIGAQFTLTECMELLKQFIP
ncbi:MAG: hypothetical protein K2H45_09300, partial [Acetatifactor sp.]|nr:hypothetical protein [Acetatifactor sp.]